MARVKKSAVDTSVVDEQSAAKKKKIEETTVTVIDNAIDWFNRLSGDDNIRHAAVTTCALIRDSVGIVYQDNMWPLIPMIYDAVFESLIEHLASKRSMYKKYKIIVGNNFVMSYDNIADDGTYWNLYSPEW